MKSFKTYISEIKFTDRLKLPSDKNEFDTKKIKLDGDRIEFTVNEDPTSYKIKRKIYPDVVPYDKLKEIENVPEVYFTVNDNFQIKRTKNYLKILNLAIQHVKEAINKYPTFIFSSDKDEDSRAKLYHTMATKMVKDYPEYRLEIYESIDYYIFVITKEPEENYLSDF